MDFMLILIANQLVCLMTLNLLSPFNTVIAIGVLIINA